MKGFTSALILLASAFTNQGVAAEDKPCKPVVTVSGFDIDTFISKPWYAHQQAPTEYVPIERNFCTRAMYAKKESKSILGYEIDVDNFTEDADGNKYGGKLCATIVDDAKLAVAPCFLPTVFAGPYWVLAYDEEKGYAFVSGGQPMYRSENGEGCTTGKGENDSGLWIFLRSRERDEDLIDEIRQMAKDMDIDVSVMNDVDQTNCDDEEEVVME
mmetsp:Transcript_7164/g.9721  ORF Transcript_7164/g.9721 Transcript_7164/m.9721 type:complete len:214 (-) Transcript_7164:140-781(-)|eukprot:CAMPEP_0185727894 /NCGR_PEP_ID=MMETSP1171-20130828/3440_1 /TAXON_ID=374046 /ORGANISM="Helicotheca tamensis, Strain CCMP826" /LENGTH=213 /DNA_ID=CAMNT_0028396539 /DNA_START=147 /DNA_END=788 /DNA_ORIENTATION=+